jgi:hypothetical protein
LTIKEGFFNDIFVQKEDIVVKLVNFWPERGNYYKIDFLNE